MLVSKIISQFKNLIVMLNANKQSIARQGMSHADALALQHLHKLTAPGTYYPFTEFSLRPYTIAHILNEILLNQRKLVIELGSGTSTMFIANIIQKHGLKTAFYSVDENVSWQHFLKGTFLPDNDCVTFIPAPIVAMPDVNQFTPQWYDQGVLGKYLQGQKADLIIVDGPEQKGSSRSMAIQFITQYLSDTGIVFVDDYKRPAEKKLVADLVELHGFQKSTYFRHCTLFKNRGYFTAPMR